MHLFAVGDILSCILLSAVLLLVLVGNTLVVAAVATSRKLRTVTNVFIVNLACADLLLGVLVLPFSAVLEIMDVWIFGHIWCQVWLAVDVWLCTTSILTLCCISLDRYLAITRPMQYPGLMSSRRAKTLVAGVWLFSFIIGCPPLIGWNDTSILEDGNGTTASPADAPITTFVYEATVSMAACHNHTNSRANSSCGQGIEAIGDTSSTCKLTNSQGYRIYAALGSFFVPMLVMVFFYLQIYRAAIRTINAYEKGELKLKYSVRERDDSSKTNSVTLRVHRGGRTGVQSGSWNGGGSLSARGGGKEGGMRGEGGGTGTQYSSHKCKSNNASLVTFTDLTCEALANGSTVCSPTSESARHPANRLCWKTGRRRPERQKPSTLQARHVNGRNKLSDGKHTRCTSLDSDDGSSVDSRARVARGSLHNNPSHRSSLLLKTGMSKQGESGIRFGHSMKSKRPRFTAQKPGNAIRLHMQKFNREKKAAKTLAIIVGAFILCWMPFFTIYLVGAFCESCIPPFVFSVFFWLGYCNSAVNPCVYALFSKDFRFAFRKLVTCKTISRTLSLRPQTSDAPAIQLQGPPQEEARSSSDIDNNWG